MVGLLIVEDERITVENLRSYYDWSSIGIDRVETASNGIEALEMIKRRPPDIVITDIKMLF